MGMSMTAAGNFERVGRIILKPKIWDRALTADEVRAEYEKAKAELRAKGYDIFD